MAQLNVEGYRLKVKWYETLLSTWSDGNLGQVRQIPRNVYDHTTILSYSLVAIFGLPLMWLLSHMPFIWPEMLGAFIATICVCVSATPYQDYFRALTVLIVTSVLLYCNVNLDVTVFGFHIEHYLYILVIATCLLALWRRFFNWLCWLQIDYMCEKYGIPKYDQKTLMDAYVGYDTHYKEKPILHNSYQEAVAAEKSSNQEKTTDA